MNIDIATGYAGSYERFTTPSKNDASILLGADCLVGDRFSIEFETTSSGTRAWMVNKFGARTGYFSPDVSRQLQIYQARGWKLTALLSFVAYTDSPDPGEYWGDAALICYDPRNHAEAFELFISSIGKLMQDSIRPDVALGADGVSHIIESNGTWLPNVRIELPKKEQGMAVLKRRRKLSERLIEQGRAGNKGCYAISWIFIALIVIAILAGAFFGLKALGLL